MHTIGSIGLPVRTSLETLVLTIKNMVVYHSFYHPKSGIYMALTCFNVLHVSRSACKTICAKLLLLRRSGLNSDKVRLSIGCGTLWRFPKVRGAQITMGFNTTPI